MIDIKDKKDCVGCNACLSKCPINCIHMTIDEQGFNYPEVDLDKCINCHLCEKVCPVINQNTSRIPLQTLAAKNKNKLIQKESSSGGAFYLLAEHVIKMGGVVFGARFNENWDVVHDFSETINNLAQFQTSKYVQSSIGDSYKRVENFLRLGKIVMFTGTPCQIVGLQKYLGNDYGEQLLLVDVVCHGVPSPFVWKEYLHYIARPKGAPAGKNAVFQSLNVIPSIEGISFRDKRLGWEKFGFSIRYSATEGSGKNSVFQSVNSPDKKNYSYEPLDKNIYMRMFLENLDLRPCCYNCPSKCGKSHSDITLGDYWGIKLSHPDFYDENGVSLVMLNSTNGMKYFNSIDILKIESEYDFAIKANTAIIKSVDVPQYYTEFWTELISNGFEAAVSVLNKIKPKNKELILNYIKKHCPNILKSILKRVMN